MDGEERLRQKGRLLLAGVAIGLFAAFVAFFVYARVWPSQVKANGMTYQDLITTVLTALAVLIAVLGVVVGMVALWGYAALSEQARNAARSYVRDDVENGALKRHMESLVTAYLNKESADDGLFRRILAESAERYALARNERPIGAGVTSEDEDEGDA